MESGLSARASVKVTSDILEKIDAKINENKKAQEQEDVVSALSEIRDFVFSIHYVNKEACRRGWF